MNRDETLAVRGGEPAVARRAEHALGSDRRSRRRGPAARARVDGARSARDQPAHARLRDRDERRRGAAASRIAPAVRCRTSWSPTRNGRIGWSLMGQVPVRASYDSTLPHSWRAPGGGWTGWRAPEEYPRVVDPASGRLWTANARDDRCRHLARVPRRRRLRPRRARAQIRDDLLALQTATRRGHAGDPARRPRAVPHALARSAARAARRAPRSPTIRCARRRGN